MKPIAIIAIIAVVVVVGGACAGVAFSGVLNGGTTGPGGDDPVVPTDPVDPTPTETPTETPIPTETPMSTFAPMTSSGSSTSSHTHTYSTAWTNDETNHWHDATCGHDVKKDNATHTLDTTDTFCTICGYGAAALVGETYYGTLDTAVSAAVAGTEKTVTLLVDMTEQYAVTDGTKVIINPNDKKVNLTYENITDIQIKHPLSTESKVNITGSAGSELVVTFSDTVNNGLLVADYAMSDSEMYICTADGLVTFEQMINTDSNKFNDYTVTLMNDIDLTDVEWTPINLWDAENSATLVIDGQGHTISNMSINSGEKIGFIGSIAGRTLTIQDLTFDTANVITSASMAGVVIGYQYGDVTLEGVNVTNSVVRTTADTGISIGGLIGFSAINENAVVNIAGCSVTNTILSGYHTVAGLVGKLPNYDTSTADTISGNTVSDCILSITNENANTPKRVSAFAVNGASTRSYTDDVTNCPGNTAENNTFMYYLADGLQCVDTKGEATYTITTAMGLIAWRNSDFTDKTVLLGKDIDLNNEAWTPIKDFAGTFDGQGYTISNLKDAALFNTISETGVVKNLNLEDVSANSKKIGFLVNNLNGKLENCSVRNATITSTANGGSGMVNIARNNAIIDNCSVDGFTVTVNSNDNGDKVGGLVGTLSGKAKAINSSASNITFKGNYKTKQWGGFVGYLGEGGTIDNCTANNVKITVDDYYQSVGGFVGAINVKGTITNSRADGVTIDVTKVKSGGNAGGFCGHTGGGGPHIFDNCHVTGMSITLHADGTSGIGGFTGRASFGIKVKNSSVAGEIHANEVAVSGGKVGTMFAYADTLDLNQEGAVYFENNTDNVKIIN